MSGPLITFSGIDGAGKSTQIDILLARFGNAGRKPVYLWSRGGYTPGFETAKGLARRLSRGKAVPPSGKSAERSQAFASKRTRRLWLWLAMLDLLFLYGVMIRWWRWRGCPVICDRYLWDTRIDFRLNFPAEQVEVWQLWQLLVRMTPTPDVAFLLLVPVDESMRRGALKQEPFPDDRGALDRRLAAYRAMTPEAGWIVLDCMRPVAAVSADIEQALLKALYTQSAGVPYAH